MNPHIKKSLKASDFIPSFKEEKPMEADDLYAHLMAGMAGLGVVQ